MTSFLKILLALASITFLSLIVGGCNGGGSLGNDDDDDDDATASDDDDATDHPQMSVVTITAPLPGVTVTLTRRGDEERTLLVCQTTCTTALEAGVYDGIGESEGALWVPFELEVGGGHPGGHTLVGGYVHEGEYTKYAEDCTAPLTPAGTFTLTFEEEDGEVIVRGLSANYRAEGATMISLADPSATAETLIPNRMFELRGTSTRCYIRE